MKTAIYIEDGVTQVVLTPENKFETQALGSIGKSSVDVSIMNGEFYQCQGGWNRHPSTPDTLKPSLILRLKDKERE